MQIPQIYRSIRSNVQAVPKDALKADIVLAQLLFTALGSQPKLHDVNKLLRVLTEKDVTFQEAVGILRLRKTPKGTDWYYGENGVLAVIDLWLSENKERLLHPPLPAPLSTPQVEAQNLNAAATPTLIAATNNGQEEVKKEVTRIDGNIDHARKMLARAGLQVPENDNECWEAWCNERDNWQIVNHTFYRKLQKDFFSKGLHVKNVLTVRRGENGPEVTMGPDDARQLFTNKRNTIDELVLSKDVVRRRYQTKAIEILRLINLFEVQERVLVSSTLGPMQDLEEIGDAEFNTIDNYYKRMEDLWKAQYSTNYSPREFLKAIDNIQKVTSDLISRECDLGRFQNCINDIDNTRIIPNFFQGVLPTTNENEIGLLVRTYKELLQYQKDLPVTYGLIAGGKRVAEPLDRIYGTHRGEAGLYALSFLTGVQNPSDLKVLDFCGNGVLWTIANHISSDLASNIVDLERREDNALFLNNPNPNKILVDLSNYKVEKKYNSVVLNFVLNHFNQDLNTLKQTVVSAIDHLEVPPPNSENVVIDESNIKNFPLLIISLPERYRLERSPLHDVLRSSGLVPYMQLEGENELQEGVDQNIRRERGRDVAIGVKARVNKLYKMHVYAFVDPKRLKIIREINEDAFKIEKQEASFERPNGSGGGEEGELKAERIQKNIATGNLRAIDLTVPSRRVIKSSDIVNDSRYSDFEQNLATLLWYRNDLSPKEKETLDEIVELWDWKFAPTLYEPYVKFIMEKPARIRIPFQGVPSTLQNQAQEGQSYSLKDLCRMEDIFRQRNNAPSVFQNFRSQSIVDRLRVLFKNNWGKCKPEITSLKNMRIAKTTIRQIDSTLKRFCLEGEIYQIGRAHV